MNSVELVLGLVAVILISGFVVIQIQEFYPGSNSYTSNVNQYDTEENLKIFQPENQTIIEDTTKTVIEYKVEIDWPGMKEDYNNSKQVMLTSYVIPVDQDGSLGVQGEESDHAWATHPDTNFILKRAPNRKINYTRRISLTEEHPVSPIGEYVWNAVFAYKSNNSLDWWEDGQEMDDLGTDEDPATQSTVYALSSER